MKIFTAGDMREIDAATVSLEPVSSLDLMERAAGKAFREIKKYIRANDRLVVFAGPGNNGGDGLVIARLLVKDRFNVSVFVVETGSAHSPDMQTNLERAVKAGLSCSFINSGSDIPGLKHYDVVIDAIFGSGLSRPPSGVAAELIMKINEAGTYVISVDIPSGLFCDDNSAADTDLIIRASRTITFQFPKLAFMFAGNAKYTGLWEVADIGLHRKTIDEKEHHSVFLEQADVRPLIRVRNKFDHKGSFGHALLIAGSYGKAGAAVLAGSAALRTGAGLVTLHVPVSAMTAVHSAIPEAMISPDAGEEIIMSVPDIRRYSVVGIGPGLGTDPDTRNAFSELLNEIKDPMVIDADALNILSLQPELISMIPQKSILTPHPGEFKRLTGRDESDYQRVETQVKLALTIKCIIILKGACTSVAFPDGRLFFNSTGNPGMATAGSGDVLTGMITSLLAQGYSPENAALAGVYLHGLAGDIALGKQSEESLIAGDIVKNIGRAFRALQ